MKFLCSNCKAKYQISDEKVAGRTLRMTCRRCQAEIVIRSDASSEVPSRPSMHVTRASTAPSVMPEPPPAAGGRQPSAPALPAVPAVPAVPAAAGPPPLAAVTPPPESEAWHVAVGDTPIGPVSRDEVRHRLERGAVSGASLAWREGMGDWMPIRDIPELAGLVTPPKPAGPPPLAGRGAQVSDATASAAQVSGRESAAPGGGSAVPAAVVEQAPRPQLSVALLFALAGFVAFVLTATTLAGLHFLKDGPVALAPVVAPPPTPEPEPEPEPKQAVLELPEEPELEAGSEAAEDEMVIGLEEVKPGGASTSKRRKPAAELAAPPGEPKKQLTAEQRAMLARMGGGDGSEIGGLQRTGATGATPQKTAGGVDAAALGKVVSRGKRNLQRCYEGAMRSSGVADAVRLDVQIEVSGSGNVTRVTTLGQGLPGLDTCIQRTVKAWRFPESGEAFSTRFPLVFSPGS